MGNILSIVSASGGAQSDLDKTLAQIQLTAPNMLRASERKFVDSAVNAYITTHEPTRQTIKSARMLSRRDEPVLIIGPTGTGKELIANILHAKRAFEQQALVPINCAGLTDTLFESLLFGHKRGTFTGAVADEPGLLRAAGFGTVFFDEVGELPLTQQAKLLRALQTRHVRPVGDDKEYAIDCRFVFATLRNLDDMVASGTFRVDLYYRINKFVLRTYALVERPGDVMPIVQHISMTNGWDYRDVCVVDEHGKFNPPGEETYARGNVRQLENYIARRNVLLATHQEALELL